MAVTTIQMIKRKLEQLKLGHFEECQESNSKTAFFNAPSAHAICGSIGYSINGSNSGTGV